LGDEIIDLASRRIIAGLGDGEELFERPPGDWHFVKLQTAAAIAREGLRLRHDFSDGTRAYRVNDAKWLYLSVRNAFGNPVLSLEVETDLKHVFQINSGEADTHDAMKSVASLLGRHHWGVNNTWSCGYLIDEAGICHRTEELPATIKLRGNLEIDQCKDVRLPRYMTVTGQVIFDGSHVAEAPAFIAADSLHIKGGILPRIADSLSIVGDVSVASSTEIGEIGSTVSIGGCLHVNDVKALSKMPKTLLVGTFVNAWGAGFRSLGAETWIRGPLSLPELMVHRYTPDMFGRVLEIGDILTVMNEGSLHTDVTDSIIRNGGVIRGRLMKFWQNGLSSIIVKSDSEQGYSWARVHSSDFVFHSKRPSRHILEGW
jgi:hypothetical protein